MRSNLLVSMLLSDLTHLFKIGGRPLAGLLRDFNRQFNVIKISDDLM